MHVYKDKDRGTWYVKTRYRTWNNEVKSKTKRGFATKREAGEWERHFLETVAMTPDMLFRNFADIYLRDRETRLRASTVSTKKNIIEDHLIPYFGSIPLNQIDTVKVMKWQNEMLQKTYGTKEEHYSPVFLKTVHNQLSAMLNHAVKYYRLPSNPARAVGNMGTDRGAEMSFWTLEEYRKFADAVMDDPVAFYAFETLYWTGIRFGELMALNWGDIDLERGVLSVTKTCHKEKGVEYVTDPKTRKSRRRVPMPEFLTEELKEYRAQSINHEPGDRVFLFSRAYLHHKMDAVSKRAGVKKIRIHDIRHSHVSLLINNGYSPLAIAERMGHETIYVTLHYAHLFPSIQQDMVDTLNRLNCMGGGDQDAAD